MESNQHKIPNSGQQVTQHNSPNFGQQPVQYPNLGQHAVVTVKQANGLGTAGFILALLGLIFVWVPVLSWILIILGGILSAVGLAGNKTKGLAIAGLIIAIVALLLKLLLIPMLFSAAVSSLKFKL